MNGKPHVHEVKVVVDNGFDYWRKGRVLYGDTRLTFHPKIGQKRREEQIRRLIQKAIRRHDEGSMRAQAKIDIETRLAAEANAKLHAASQAEYDFRYKYQYVTQLTEQQKAEKAKAEQNIKWASELIK